MSVKPLFIGVLRFFVKIDNVKRNVLNGVKNVGISM